MSNDEAIITIGENIIQACSVIIKNAIIRPLRWLAEPQIPVILNND